MSGNGMQSWGSSNGPRPSLGAGWDMNQYMPAMTADQFSPMPVDFSGAAFQMPSFNSGPSQLMGGGSGGSMFGDFGKGIGDWMNNSGFLGKKMVNGDQVQGWGAPVIGAAQGLANAYLGFKTLGMEKDKLAESKRQFEMNWGAQQKAVNSRLEDRQRARVASNATAYQSPTDYMKQNGI